MPTFCFKALEFDPKNIKAMFRLAQGYQKEGEFEKAREWFLRSQKQEPNNSEIRAALQKLDQYVLSIKKILLKILVLHLFENHHAFLGMLNVGD